MSDKKIFSSAVLGLLLLEILRFSTFYIPNYVVEIKSAAALYILEFIGRLIAFVIPCLGAALLTFSRLASARKLALRALAVSATSALYSFFYYYLYFLAYGNDSVEGSLLALGAAALGVAVNFAYILVLYFAVREVGVRIIASELKGNLPPVKQRCLAKSEAVKIRSDAKRDYEARLYEGKLFELASPAVAGIFSACFLQFCVMLLSEVVSIVGYLVEYAGTYRSGEIAYIVASLLFIFAELFVAHLCCLGLRNFILKRGNEA